MIGAAPAWLAAAGALALGLIAGSFANVCIHRLPRGDSVVTPRSRCPRCGGLIRWFDNIPVLSWVLLGARCRDCREPIPWTYPAVEALMAAGFLGAWLRFGTGVEAVAAAWLWFACIVLTIIDFRHFILPDVITLTGLAGGLVLAGWRAARTVLVEGRGEGMAGWLGGPFDEPVLPLAALAGALAGAAMPLLARGGYMLIRRRSAGPEEPEPGALPHGNPPREEDGEATVEEAALEEGMGLGDVKMLAMVGAFLGARMAFMTILIGSLSGCFLVLPWLAFTRRGFRTPVPFGPFLALGAIIVLFAGDAIAGAYTDLVRRLIL